MRVLLVLLMIVAIWRATRFLLKDDLPPVRLVREWFIFTFGTVADGKVVAGKRFGIVGFTIAYLWTCPWCMSFWVGLLIWAGADWRLSVPFPWLIVAAGSALSGWMAALEYRIDQRGELSDRELGR